jgi:hypothetical protein
MFGDRFLMRAYLRVPPRASFEPSLTNVDPRG